jgi:hypothetical protein
MPRGPARAPALGGMRAARVKGREERGGVAIGRDFD